VSGVDHVTDHALKNLTFGSLSAAHVRGFQNLGFRSLTVTELQDLAIRHATPDYVKALRDLGVTGTDTLSNIVDLKFTDVPVAFVKELSDLGYRRLTARELVTLKNAGVTATFAREVRQSSSSASTVQDLLEARARSRALDRERKPKRP
jgi:hypothetical protein